jgi:hypothetical protein
MIDDEVGTADVSATVVVLVALLAVLVTTTDEECPKVEVETTTVELFI